MKAGYSYAIFSENLHALLRQAMPRTEAAAKAYAHARVCFFKSHPGGALPEWLAYPSNYRLREHYTSTGEPVQHSPQYRNNPSKPVGEIERARKLFKDFTGHEAHTVRAMRMPKQPRAGLVFGQLIQVGYRSARDGQLYRHTFRSNKSRPLLIASSDGKQLIIVGGRYNFTERGIEDA